jgi:hypothetical protein
MEKVFQPGSAGWATRFEFLEKLRDGMARGLSRNVPRCLARLVAHRHIRRVVHKKPDHIDRARKRRFV